ncbi:MAG: hypothetical protein HKO92_05175 [Flavobacteriaceae bacterium]|nr:hypothetical protein [Flavobacteriaceae bacterium]
MRTTVFLFCFFICLASCKEQTEIAKTEKEPLIMVEQSEMALLMNEMFAFNESIKQQIKEGKLHNVYPEHFNKIHTAVLTDPTDRNAAFKKDAQHFLDAQKSLFEVTSTEELKTYYNNAVNACISCHEVTCVGPIPRIKKLFIK